MSCADEVFGNRNATDVLRQYFHKTSMTTDPTKDASSARPITTRLSSC
jgi:hypothetical protein